MTILGTFVAVTISLASLAVAVTLASARTTERVSIDSAGNQGNDHRSTPAISANGRFVAVDSGASRVYKAFIS